MPELIKAPKQIEALASPGQEAAAQAISEAQGNHVIDPRAAEVLKSLKHRPEIVEAVIESTKKLH